jgi:rod shape-determining protein MreC
MVYAAAMSGASVLPEQALRTVTAPFAQLSSAVSTFVTGNIDKIVNADKYKAENDELRQTISDLLTQIVSIDELKNDNQLLREMLAITESHPDFEWPSNTCTISAWNSNDPFNGFTINRGSGDGIGLFDLVITGVGVVGRITEVAPNYAVVTTILSPETNIGVLTTNGNVKGILQNDIIFARDGLVRVTNIDKDANINEGDIVVTMGTDMHPPNQVIGTVVEVYDDPNLTSKHALVQPSEDARGLTNVLVIRGFEGRMDMNLGQSEQDE